jgi:hypothetical protein
MGMERKMAVPGLTTIASHLSPQATMDRLESEVKAKGIRRRWKP